MARENPRPPARGTPRSGSGPAGQRSTPVAGGAGANDALGSTAPLPCPSCDLDLSEADLFDEFRVCPSCRRHFPLPARERVRQLADQDSFIETNAALVSVDPLVFRDLLPVPDRLDAARERATGGLTPEGSVREAVITGVGEISGRQAVLVILDHAYLGSEIGLVAGEKIVLAMELAEQRRLPLIVLCAAGGARTRPGFLSLSQLAKIASSATALHRAGVPFVSVLSHPTTGSIYAGLANQADIILAEPGARIGYGAGATRGARREPGAKTNPAEVVLAHGLIDAVTDRLALRETLGTLLHLFADRGAYHQAPPSPSTAPDHPTPAREAATIARDPSRPAALHYLRRIVTDFVELHGDRATGDDPTVVCGLGRLAERPIVIIAQHRPPAPGSTLDRDHPHAPRIGPSGYRKAIRVMRFGGSPRVADRELGRYAGNRRRTSGGSRRHRRRHRPGTGVAEHVARANRHRHRR